MKTYPLASGYWMAAIGRQLNHVQALKETGLGIVGQGLGRLQETEPAGRAPPSSSSDASERARERGSSPGRAEDEGRGAPQAKPEVAGATRAPRARKEKARKGRVVLERARARTSRLRGRSLRNS